MERVPQGHLLLGFRGVGLSPTALPLEMEYQATLCLSQHPPPSSASFDVPCWQGGAQRLPPASLKWGTALWPPTWQSQGHPVHPGFGGGVGPQPWDRGLSPRGSLKVLGGG